MKYYIIILGALALASCSGNSSNTTVTDTTADTIKTDTIASKLSTPAQNMEYCFVNTQGTSSEDTTAVHLIINANKVTGDMKWIPKEKDSRKGKLAGTIDGNTIKAVWSFMQEGMTDTMAVEFKLSAQQLAQKPTVYNKTEGREQLDKKADYTILYKLDNCERFRNQ